MASNYFFKSINHLFKKEEILLFNNIFKIKESEKEEVSEFVKTQFDAEVLTYPYIAPDFNAKAAIWSAEFIYKAAQLMLYREDKADDLESILPNESFLCDPSTVISVDLCLRFLPDMLVQLRLLDKEDALIPILEEKLKKWHYSGVNSDLDISAEDWQDIVIDDCLCQLYINRIIKFKNNKLAKLPAVNQRIIDQTGLHQNEFWPNFKSIELND